MRRPYFDNPDLPLSELFHHWPACAAAFMRRRMLCPGCPIAPFHTLIDACNEYGLEEMVFREQLRGLRGVIKLFERYRGWSLAIMDRLHHLSSAKLLPRPSVS